MRANRDRNYTGRGLMLSSRQIVLVPEFKRTLASSHSNQDTSLLRSIARYGIQQPLTVMHLAEDKFYLIDGYRRYFSAQRLDIQGKIPAVDITEEYEPSKWVSKEHFMSLKRVVLNVHRQDLSPSVRAKLLKEEMERFGLSAREIALGLGYSTGSIRNFLLVDECIDEIKRLIDSGSLKENWARAFHVFTPTAQKELLDQYFEQMAKPGYKARLTAPRAHQEFRKTYPPEQFPEKYKSAAEIARYLLKAKTSSQTRAGRKRLSLSGRDAQQYESDLSKLQLENEMLEAEIERLGFWIRKAERLVRAVWANPGLREFIPSGEHWAFERHA